MSYIGFSLSFCVRDLAAGVIPLEEVIGIRSAVRITTPQDWATLFADYRETYWVNDPDRCEAIARQLLAQEGIIQPRLNDEPVRSIANGHWEKDGVLLPDATLRAMYHDLALQRSSLPSDPLST